MHAKSSVSSSGKSSAHHDIAVGKGKVVTVVTLPQGRIVGHPYSSSQYHASTSRLGSVNGPTPHKRNKGPNSSYENNLGLLHIDFTKNANKDKPNSPMDKAHKNPHLGMAAKGSLPVLSITFETTESQKLIQTAANPHPMASPHSDPSMSVTQITDSNMTEIEEQAFNSSNLSISRTFPDYFPSHLRFFEAIPNTSNHRPIHSPSPGPNILHSPIFNDPFPNFLARDRTNEPSNPSTSGMEGDQVQGNNPRPMQLSTSSDGRVESRSHKLRPEHMVVNTNDTNQPSPNSSIISGDAECRDDPYGVIPAISPCKNSTSIGEGPFFYANT
ncbi:hypothetical protein FXO38_35690 [Capsicum annuum]|nr:hypothetical protein FXO37_36328 [Capsicum annuum]KAF3614412.1 hypothetical protein FXO38_35690 [Capsicum annuum]